jgi:thioredoxin 1
MHTTPDNIGASTSRPASTDNIETLTAANFEQRALRAQGPVVVEFMSYGCSHCQTMEPVLQEVAEAVKSRIGIDRVDVNADPQLTDTYAIEGTPTFIMLKDGNEIDRIEGPQPEYSTLLTALTRSFAS